MLMRRSGGRFVLVPGLGSGFGSGSWSGIGLVEDACPIASGDKALCSNKAPKSNVCNASTALTRASWSKHITPRVRWSVSTGRIACGGMGGLPGPAPRAVRAANDLSAWSS